MSTQTKASVQIRWMIRRDMPEVMAIEESSFSDPYPESELVQMLRNRNCVGMVAEVTERIAGFMIYELHRKWLRVLDFAVHPNCRSAGVGTSMVNKLCSKLSPQRRFAITIDVRESNLPAQLFFRNRGFRAISIVRGLYEGTDEDAYRMQFHIEPW